MPSLSGPQSVAPRTILRTFVLCCLVGFVFYSSCPGRCPSQSMFGILWPGSMVAELWFTQWRSRSGIWRLVAGILVVDCVKRRRRAGRSCEISKSKKNIHATQLQAWKSENFLDGCSGSGQALSTLRTLMRRGVFAWGSAAYRGVTLRVLTTPKRATEAD